MFLLFRYCTSGHCLSKSSLQLMLASVFTLWNSENQRTYSVRLPLREKYPNTELFLVLYFPQCSLWFTQKNNFCMINKIKLVWFYSLYRNYFFESKCVLLNIFHHVTLENISRMLNNFVYFQNIVVYNEALKTFTRNFQNTF